MQENLLTAYSIGELTDYSAPQTRALTDDEGAWYPVLYPHLGLSGFGPRCRLPS